MKEITHQVIADGALKLASISGVTASALAFFRDTFEFINQYAAGIGVILTFISLCVGIGISRQKAKNTAEIEKLKNESRLLRDHLAKIGHRKSDKVK